MYIKKDVYHNLYKNIAEETCNLGKMSNSFEITANYNNWKNNVSYYCQLRDCNCNLITAIKSGSPAPPQLNYTHFNYKINMSCGTSIFVQNFTC